MSFRLVTVLLCAIMVGSHGLNAAEVDVKAFGAIGDGIADDATAIARAVQQLHQQQGGTLFFPTGTYRFAAPSKANGAIVLNGLKNVTIQFAPDALLLMDNLRTDGSGDGHGLVVKGPAENIALKNVNIKWKVKPNKRSCGDGIRFEGYPDEAQTVKNITMQNCRIEAAPQTGAVLMGCMDINIKNFSSIDTLADGLHLNACQNINIDGVRGINNGDDTLAFVTYYDAHDIGKRPGPFSQPGLTKWCNNNSTAINVTAISGRANGVRISQGQNIRLENINVTDKGSGIIIDAGEKDLRHKWQYLPSQKIKIKNLTAQKCNTGFFVENFSGSDPFRHFEITAQLLKINDCTNDGIHITEADRVKLTELKLNNNRIRLRNASNVSITDLQMSDSWFFIDGNVANKIPADQQKPCGIVVVNATVNRNNAVFQNIVGLECRNLTIKDAPDTALQLSRVTDSIFKQVQTIHFNTSNKPGVTPIRQVNCHRLTFSESPKKN